MSEHRAVSFNFRRSTSFRRPGRVRVLLCHGNDRYGQRRELQARITCDQALLFLLVREGLERSSSEKLLSSPSRTRRLAREGIASMQRGLQRQFPSIGLPTPAPVRTAGDQLYHRSEEGAQVRPALSPAAVIKNSSILIHCLVFSRDILCQSLTTRD